MIYLDNAATSYPKPPEVMKAVCGVMEKIGGNPGRGGHAGALWVVKNKMGMGQQPRFAARPIGEHNIGPFQG